MIDLELLLGVVEPLEKGDDSFLSFEDVALTLVLVPSIMKIYELTKIINQDNKSIKYERLIEYEIS